MGLRRSVYSRERLHESARRAKPDNTLEGNADCVQAGRTCLRDAEAPPQRPSEAKVMREDGREGMSERKHKSAVPFLQ